MFNSHSWSPIFAITTKKEKNADKNEKSRKKEKRQKKEWWKKGKIKGRKKGRGSLTTFTNEEMFWNFSQ